MRYPAYLAGLGHVDLMSDHMSAGEESALQQEVRRLRDENANLAQQVRNYEAHANIISMSRVGHTGSRTKS